MIRILSILIAAWLGAAVAASAARAKEPPLFAADAPLHITIAGPVDELVRNMSRAPAPYAATLTLAGGESHAIELSARGNSRRKKDICAFPPLRVRFQEKPAKGSVFHKQRSLKLVTHCRKKESFQQYALLEYAAYRLMNVMTPASFRVRLAEIAYLDEDGDEIIRRMGFFIEDVDDLAEREGMTEAHAGFIRRSDLSAAAADIVLFQYMIGNTDWGFLPPENSEECCHNIKLIGDAQKQAPPFTPVAYDFDLSGLINAPYAQPAAELRITSVRRRVYRGFCTLNDDARNAAPRFRGNRAALLAVIGEVPGLEEKPRARALDYLDGFFDDIADDEALEKKLLSHCRD